MQVLTSLIEPNLPLPSPIHLQAIEKGDYEGFEESITEIKAEAEKPEFLAQFENRAFHSPLDLFDVLDRSKQIYAMTLMAFCGVHGQR